MLIPLNAAVVDRLVPAIATYPQYAHIWGKVPDFLRRLSISAVAVVACWLVGLALGESFEPFAFMLGFGAGLYWFWAPIYWASLKNRRFRKYPYWGFWEGQIVDAYVTEEPIGREETVNDRGDLVIVENRERRINVEVEDETGYYQTIQVPLKREHKGLAAGLAVQMIVFSDRPDLSRIVDSSDLYVPARRLWVSDYPVVQRETFAEISAQLGRSRDSVNGPTQNRRRRSSGPSRPAPRSNRSDLALRPRSPRPGGEFYDDGDDDYGDRYGEDRDYRDYRDDSDYPEDRDYPRDRRY
jgi:hypothetical protein